METTENLTQSSFFGFKCEKILEEQTKYQKLEIFDTVEYGKVLKLDDKFMTSEKDEFFYHEAMVHPATFALNNPKKALIIGGGDGGMAKHLLMHESIEKIVIAELDERVVEVSKEFLYKVHENSFGNDKVQVLIGDGMKFVENTKEMFDIVFLDLTDINTPAKHLYDKECLEKVSKILTKNGCLVMHLGAPVCIESSHDSIKKTIGVIKDIYRRTCFYGCYVPLYGSYWPMVIASHGTDASKMSEMSIKRKMGDNFKKLKYYNPRIHDTLFSLPNFYLNLISE